MVGGSGVGWAGPGSCTTFLGGILSLLAMADGMRFLILLAFIANLALLAYGQGFFGVPPADQDRNPRPLSQRNQQSLVLGAPLSTQNNTP